MEEKEVVAQRKTSLAVGFIAIIVMGVIFLVGGIVWGLIEGESGSGIILVGVIAGIGFIIIGVVQTVLFYRVPKEAIVLKDDMLYIGKNIVCSPVEVTHCKITITRRNGIADRWGKLSLRINDGKEIHINYIDRIKEVQERLGELKAEYYDKLHAQDAPETNAEAPAAAPATDTDPFGNL